MPKKVLDIKPPKKREGLLPAPPSRELPKLEVKEEEPKILLPSQAKKIPWLKIIYLVLVLILASLGALFTLAKVKIEIWPEVETKKLETKLTVDKNLKESNPAVWLQTGTIPGQLVNTQKSVSAEFSASGKKFLEKKAEGVIRVYNNYSLPQTLVANTRFQPPLEKFQPSLEENEKPWFRTKEKITIASKSYQDVKVIADSPGEKYNIPPSKFSIPGLAGSPQYTLVYGESFETFKGGLKKAVSVLSAEDLERAKNELSPQAIEMSRIELLAKIPTDFLFLEQSLEGQIIDASSLVKPGTEVEKFNFGVKAESATLAFKKEYLEKFAKEYILSRIPAGQKIYEASLKINYSLQSSDLKTGKMILALALEAKIYPPIDENLLKKGLAGRTVNEARFFLENQPDISRAKIGFWFFWFKKLPKAPEKIEINLRID